MTVYLLGVFIGALDTGVLGPAFPLIAHSFHISLAWDAWTVTVYTVAYVACTVLAGAAGDRFGHRRLFIVGVAAFGVASLLAALSGTFWLFLLARAIQGAGAGAVYPNAQAEGVRQFPPDRRGTALGLFGAVFGVATVIGPNVGGALTQYVGWPAIFLVNVPIAVVVLLLAPRLPEAPRTGRALPDWLGGASFAALLGAALLTIAVPGAARLPVAAVAVLIAALFWWRQRRAATPFIDPRPLGGWAGAALVAGAAIIGLDMSAAIFVPTLAQSALGLGVFASGVALMPAALSAAVLAGAGGVLSDRIGPRAVLQAGLLAAVVGGLVLGVSHLTLWRFGLAMLALGVSLAFTMGAPLNRMALAMYREDQAAEALSLVAVFRSVGLAAGPVLLTAVQARMGFAGMFQAFALASVVGLLLFFAVPDVRPAARPVRVRAAGGR